MQEENLSLNEVVSKIERLLLKHTDRLDGQFLDQYCDFYQGVLHHFALEDTSSTMRTFARNLYSIDRRDSYQDLEGQDILDLLLTKMTPDDIVSKMLEHSGVDVDDSHPRKLVIERASVGEFEHVVYCEDVDGLIELQDQLPDGHKLKHEEITCTGYPCDGVLLLLDFPRFIAAASPVLDAIIADKAISNPLEDQSEEAV